MGDGRIFLKTGRDASFNKDLSNEPNFDRSISLDSTFNHEISVIAKLLENSFFLLAGAN